MNNMNQDEKYMARCLELAQQAEYDVAPNPMVGAVLVADDGTVLAEGWHQQYGGPHAEVNCFRDAEAKGVTSEQIQAATLYVSLEPCSHYGKTPPCAALVVSKRPKRLVCGMLDPNPLVSGKGVQMVKDAGIDVTCGVLESECRWLNKRFLKLHEHHRPYIIVKWAQTADGYIDNRDVDIIYNELPGEKSKPLVISTEETKRLVHKMRAENMAILIGSRTALMDDPKLRTTRWEGRSPIRILLDSRGRVPETANILKDANEPSDYAGHPRTYAYKGTPSAPGVATNTYAMRALVEFMASKNIHSVLVEGGAHVLNSFLQSDLYDEVHIEINPRLVAGKGTKAPQVPAGGKRTEEVVDGNTMITILR